MHNYVHKYFFFKNVESDIYPTSGVRKEKKKKVLHSSEFERERENSFLLNK